MTILTINIDKYQHSCAKLHIFPRRNSSEAKPIFRFKKNTQKNILLKEQNWNFFFLLHMEIVEVSQDDINGHYLVFFICN